MNRFTSLGAVVVAVAVLGSAGACGDKGGVEVQGAATKSVHEIPFDAAALDGDPEMAEVARESSEADRTDAADPFLGWRGTTYTGRHVNVVDGERRTYRPLGLTQGDPQIWMFGGSALFGYGSQRDDHTVASELVRAAEADGVALEVRNFAHPGYLNYQETMLLVRLLAEGERPDVVVFHDGYNDRIFNIGSELLGSSGAGQVSYALFPEVDRLVQERFAPDQAVDDTSLARAVGDPVDRQELLDLAVDLYRQGMDLARNLGSAYGFEVIHTLQPDLFSKERVGDEQEIARAAGYDDEMTKATDRLAADYRDALESAGVADLTGVFDGLDRPVMVDAMHISEDGAAVVGADLWALVHPLVPR